MTRLPFVWVDVFAQVALTGNPLALVPEADGLTDAQMKAIAKEFNQSETTFVMRPTDPTAHYRLRSFTPGGAEVSGAGHNAMGAWVWLSLSGHLDGRGAEFTQQIGGDLLPVRVDRAATGGPLVAMRQSAPLFLAVADDRGAIEESLGLDQGAIRLDMPTQVVSTGAEHLLVPLRSPEHVDRCSPRSEVLREILLAHGAEGCYVYALTPAETGRDAYARFFNPTVGIVEDPATGTAAGPLAAMLVRERRIGREGSVTIEQGRAIGRPSVLRVEVAGQRVELSGSGVIAAEGVLFL